MILLSIAAVLAVLALIALAVGKVEKTTGSMYSRSTEEVSLRPLGATLALFAIALTVLSTLTIVGTRNYGVVTTFGAPTGRVLDNGLHFKAPWQKVTDIDGAIDGQKFTGEKNCIDVTISDGSTACVSSVVRTSIDKAAADDLFQSYRGTAEDYDSINDAVNDQLVRTQYTAALAAVFADFNPLLTVDNQDDATNAGAVAPDLEKFTALAKTKLVDLLADQAADGKPQIDVQGVTISRIYLSKATQSRLNQLQAEVGNTRIAEQRKATAIKQAEANEKLKASVADPNVLAARCFDILAERTDKGLPIPAAFSCYPGSSTPATVSVK